MIDMVHSRAVLFPLTSDCYLSTPAWYGIVWYGSLSRLGSPSWVEWELLTFGAL